MNAHGAPELAIFADGARRAARRVAWQHAARIAQRGAWGAAAIALLLMLCAALGYGLVLPWWSLGIVPAALCLIVVWAWSQRPSAAAALAAWDHAADRHQGFVTAWQVVHQAQRTPLAQVHVQRMAVAMAQASCARDLPLRTPWRAVACAALVIAACVFAPQVDHAVSELRYPRLSEREQAALHSELTALKLGMEQLAANKAVDPAAQAKANEIKKGVEDLLANAPGGEAAATLAKLDALATIAKTMEAELSGQPIAISPELFAALAANADLSGLAAAISKGDKSLTADELAKLADAMGKGTMSQDEQRRLATALGDAANAAKGGDNGALGKALSAAAAAAAAGDQAGAAKALAQAGAAMQGQAQRAAAGRQAGDMARALRQAGANALGGGAMAQAGAAGDKNNAAPPLALAAPKTLPQALFGQAPGRPDGGGNNRNGQQPGKNQGGRAQPPGAQNGGGNQGGGNQGGGNQPPPPGQQQIPVPGEEQQDDAGAGAGAGMGAGRRKAPVPGAVASSGGQNGKKGGSKAGRGHDPKVVGERTAPPPAGGQQSNVHAPFGRGAQGETKESTGGERSEDVVSALDQTPAQALDAAEAALETDAVPLHRRAQVKQYFTLIRQRLER